MQTGLAGYCTCLPGNCLVARANPDHKQDTARQCQQKEDDQKTFLQLTPTIVRAPSILAAQNWQLHCQSEKKIYVRPLKAGGALDSRVYRFWVTYGQTSCASVPSVVWQRLQPLWEETAWSGVMLPKTVELTGLLSADSQTGLRLNSSENIPTCISSYHRNRLPLCKSEKTLKESRCHMCSCNKQQ